MSGRCSALLSQAQLLLAGPAFDVKLTHLEVMDDAVGPAGCRAIGDALMLGGNATLMTLRLDLNKGILDAGAIELCKGLRTNRTLSVSHKQRFPTPLAQSRPRSITQDCFARGIVCCRRPRRL